MDDTRICGHLKSFNQAKGYGFLVPDEPLENGGDVFIHHSVFTAANAQGSARPGTRLLCTIQRSSVTGRPYAKKLLLAEEPIPQWGTVLWYSQVRGFGFVIFKETNKQALCRAETVKRSGLQHIETGQQLRVTLMKTEKGLRVTAILSQRQTSELS